MIRFGLSVLAMGAAMSLLSSSAFAGNTHERAGCYIGFGLGFGGANWTEGSALLAAGGRRDAPPVVMSPLGVIKSEPSDIG